jgi:cystathionine beta-lyase/cystathionine gamma-synthase
MVAYALLRMGSELRFDTLAVHAGTGYLAIDGAYPTAPPIVTASSYWYASPDELDRVLGDEQPGYSYARYASPTVAAFEEAVAALEAAPEAVAFGSGMAAVHAVVRACAPGPGCVVFASQDCYGGTFTLLASTLAQEGLDVRFVDVFDLPMLEQRMAAERPRALLFEVVSNPLERVADLPALVALTERYGVTALVDSTFTTPCLIRPLEHGAQYVIHSATKYLGGHGDVTGGVVACATPEQAAGLRTWRKYTGAVLGAQDAYLALRGVRTLSLRVERQCSNAEAVAQALAADARIERVFYPGLVDDPCHAVASRQFPPKLFGAVLAFAVRDAGRDDVMRLMERLRIVRAAPTMGDCFSLILYPVIASHRGLTPEQRRERGIHDNVLRFSAGIEDPRDLVEDFQQALAG